jgi:alkanesulfonate monooxygenase SsuD/methylene tetrahydromethanopterin reductase-like flavin-dependent oxidoreductase (luciferase family)
MVRRLPDKDVDTLKTSVLIPTTGDIATVREHTAVADQLGYDSINCSHIAARDSFTTLAGLAHLAPSVTLATAVAPIYHRSPASMAQTAATIDDLSGGRFRLGLGTGHRATMGGWHGQDIGNPVAEMREYVALVRALLAGGEPPTGLRWNSSFAFNGFQVRADIPIYLAGLSPAMLRLAGEIADGVVLWACPASYVADVVVREVAAGRARAGRDLAGFDICAAVPSAVVDRRATKPTSRPTTPRPTSRPSAPRSPTRSSRISARSGNRRTWPRAWPGIAPRAPPTR